MQNISFNFRQTDSTLALNAHFSGLVPYGVRTGMTLRPDPESPYFLLLAPGSLLSKEGVLITETTEKQISINTATVTNAQTVRVDAVVAKYAYAAVSPAPDCTYLLVAGTEVSIDSVLNLADLAPTNLDADMYVLGYLVRQNRSMDNTSIFYHKRLSDDVFATARTFKTVGHALTLNGSNIVVAGGISKINDYGTTITDETIIQKTAGVQQITVPTNVEQVIDLPGFGADRFATPVYVKHTDPGFDWAFVSGITVKYYKTKQDKISGTMTTSLFNSAVMINAPYDDVTGLRQLPIGICYGIYSVEFISALTTNITVVIDDIQPIFLFNPGAPGQAVAVVATEVRDNIIKLASGALIPRDYSAHLGYVTGSGDVVCARQNINNSILTKPNIAGITPLYHFNGSLNYSVVAVDNLTNELYYNNDMLDTVGARRIYKTPDVALIFTTGSGDPDLITEFILLRT